MAAAEELDVDGIAVRLTNPDKVYFPKLGSKGTKRHLVDYYRAVGGGPMLDALRDRPTHLQRFPDGVDGEEIYQKRIPQHHPDYLQTCQVTFPSGRTADALKVTHPAAIVWAAQMGTVTLHPWQVRCPDTDHPDELRIDLDPQPGVAFEQARTVAVDVLRPLLDELGSGRIPEDLGWSRNPRLSADRQRLGLHRGAPRRHRPGPRSRAPRARRRHHVLVEGRTRRAHFHRLQPERSGPHHGVAIFGAAHPDRDGIDATDVGGACRRRAGRLHHGDRARSGQGPRRPLGRNGRCGPIDRSFVGDGRGRRRARAWGHAVSAELSENAGRTEAGAAIPKYRFQKREG